jgi:hypothetical protein
MRALALPQARHKVPCKMRRGINWNRLPLGDRVYDLTMFTIILSLYQLLCGFLDMLALFGTVE